MKKELPLEGITTKPKGHKLLGVHPPALATPLKLSSTSPWSGMQEWLPDTLSEM